MTGGTEDRDRECGRPIDAAVLIDYWLGLLEPSDEADVDTHLLECDRCGERLRTLIPVVEKIQHIARTGLLRMVVSEGFVERARAEGVRVREYTVRPGGSVQCTVTADDDLLVGRLAADLTGVTRVDLCWCDAHGVEQVRLPDIPVRPGAQSVVVQESIEEAKASPTQTLIARLVTFDERGGERLIGEYTFNHTRSMPGPPS